MIDQIVDLIVREAKRRGGDFPAKVCAVKHEAMLKIMDILDKHREEERREQKRKCSTRSDDPSPVQD